MLKPFAIRQRLIVYLFSVILLGLILKNGWVNEDAYITFRTVDNFVNGYGLTWNVSERVQSYTHPLWMLLMSLAYLLTREILYTSIAVSVLVTTMALLVFVFGIIRDIRSAILGVFILAFSRAFIDYSTSGMENCLSHFLLAVFLWQYLKNDFNPKRFFLLSLIAGFGLVNRMDTLLLFLPALLYSFCQVKNHQRKKAFLLGVAGLGPFWLWESFSLFYYGFLLPNTAYAKLNLDIPKIEMIQQGLYYVIQSSRWDPLSSAVIAAGIVVPLLKRRWDLAAVSSGILLYLLYVVWAGGDYLAGRFLSAPFFCAAVLVIVSFPWRSLFLWRIALLAIVGLGYRAVYPNFLSGADYGQKRTEYRHQTYLDNILDARRLDYNFTSLLSPREKQKEWAKEGRHAAVKGEKVIERESIGNFGYYAGPKVHIIDKMALADPLLAKIPRLHPAMTSRRFLASEPRYGFVPFFAGHYERVVPDGYMETLLSGQNKIEDKALAAYYDKLALVIKGNLWDFRRLAEIWRFNTGGRDSLMREYLKNPKLRLASFLLSEMEEGEEIFGVAGVEVDLERKYHAHRLELQLGNKHDYVVAFTDSRLKKGKIFTRNIRAKTTQDTGVIGESVLTSYQVPVPLKATLSGFDRVYIVPRPDDDKIPRVDKGKYKIGGIRFIE